MEHKISSYGRYQGYGTFYPSYIKKSIYVDVPAFYEGAYQSDPFYEKQTVALALDYVLPADHNNQVVPGKFPAIVMASRDPFRFKPDDAIGNCPEGIYLVQHGYALIIINMRGCGASFGVNNSFSSLENRLDIKYVMEHWAPEQPWYNGKFAMMGGSNRGLIQGAVAAVTPKGLKGITPSICNMEFYFGNFPNGVSGSLCSMNGLPGEIIAFLQGEENPNQILPYDKWIKTTSTAFTDADPEGKLAYRAYRYRIERNKLFGVYMVLPNMNRDSKNENMYGEPVYLTIPPAEYTEEIRNSGIQTHQLAGYFDQNAASQVALANAWNKGSVVLGPWTHAQTLFGQSDPAVYPNNSFDLRQDYHRWFDYLLKDMDNGYDQAPRFYYYLIGAEPGTEWRYAESIRPHNSHYRMMFLTAEGALCEEAPFCSEKTAYRIDTSIAMPQDYCWHTIYTAEPMNNCVDAKARVFTTAPAETDLDLVGIPTIDLWISSENSNDVDLLVYLEIVDENGESHYLSRAYMRASHRTLGQHPVWETTEGLAGRFHPSLTEDIATKKAEGLQQPVLLQFEFDLVARRVKKGQQLRISVTGANMASCQHYMYYDYQDGIYVEKPEERLPVIDIHSGGSRASFISLPVMDDEQNVLVGQIQNSETIVPAKLYWFQEHVYLYSNDVWSKYRPEDCARKGDTISLNGTIFVCTEPAMYNGVM